MIKSTAEFSPCRTWRYSLTRCWDETLPTIAFICLNPSTADETVNDPTVRRCIDYAQRWGFGRFVMLNLFAFRATDPGDMMAAVDPVGPENDWHIRMNFERVSAVVLAWGNDGAFRGRSRHVMKLLAGARTRHTPRLECLTITGLGEPGHPLYLRKDLTRRLFEVTA